MKTNYINEICTTLKQLKKAYPNQNLGRHLDAAFADYGSLFGVSDREILFALHKYQAELEIDPIASDAEIERIIKDGENLNVNFLFDEEDEEDEF